MLESLYKKFIPCIRIPLPEPKQFPRHLRLRPSLV